MRRLTVLVTLLTLIPALGAGAAELDELLEKSREATYNAEQAISCSTPDGLRFALVRISQQRDEIRVSSVVGDDVEVTSGDGGWVLSRRGGVVSSTAVDAEAREVEPLYSVRDLGERTVVGREATAYSLIREGITRAELIFDDETGAMVAATTFNADGEVYCQRRFISFEPTRAVFEPDQQRDIEELEPAPEVETTLPEAVEGFQRLDLYEDDLGFRFAYYSDGFFSFAVFETPSRIRMGEVELVEVGEFEYFRAFTPGQVRYVWEVPDGGMALVGDLPPDLHEAVLATLPDPTPPNLFRRLWRSLFG